MTLFKNKYRVETTRLQSWDYVWGGWYYITICTKNMNCFFGGIANETMTISPVGEIAFQFWSDIPKHFTTTEPDEFQIMPNHLHGIVVLSDPSPAKPEVKPNANLEGIKKRMSAISPKPGSVGAIVRSFKSAVAKEAHQRGSGRFGWQERFYDHIIRHEFDLHRIRTYIHDNVLRWEIEKNYPENFIKTLRS